MAEWFGYRVFPTVRGSADSLRNQRAQRCPFLSQAVGEDAPCIKPPASQGVCTISAASNGYRQDWLVCPNRVVETELLNDVVDCLFGKEPAGQRLTLAVPRLEKQEARHKILQALAAGGRPIVYLREKLGGEISLARTAKSPELSFDITLVELSADSGHPQVSRYAVCEIQTMDFHGTYRHAVDNLQHSLRLHGDRVSEEISRNPRWLSERIEGPNIANVFKRTFYQLMFKLRLGEAPGCAGAVVALPQAVWDSWQRHLGGPTLEPREDGTWLLRKPGQTKQVDKRSWIYVFDIDAAAEQDPNPVQITRRIVTTADDLSYFALTLAPEEAMRVGGVVSLVPQTIERRLLQWWPTLLKEKL